MTSSSNRGLDLSTLRQAHAALERSLQVLQRPGQDMQDVDLYQTLRSGVIQNFETSYEASWKLMKRWIEENVGAQQVDGVPRRELFRQAAEQHLIADVEEWMNYHRARNATSHLYAEDVAESVLASARVFAPACLELLFALESRQ